MSRTPDLVRPIVRGQNTRLFRAWLAEEYDGIGQHVMVSLSRASQSAAILARVASGDFATTVKFPAGTPVVVFSERGTLEVLSLGG